MYQLVLAAALLGPGGSVPDPRALALVDTAIARIGGRVALGRLERVRLEMMTQWQHITFDQRPYTDEPVYERHSELRDYSIPAWRNTRRFPNGGTPPEITDVVRDSVAIRRSTGGTWAPLSVAYVDERREVFTFSPDHVLLIARDAADLKPMPDTTIGSVRHARVSATLNGYPSTLFFRRTDGLLALARYQAAQPNDYGLASWGRMEVELWYSSWKQTAAGVALPMQWDMRRVGRPYKRMTVLSFAIDTAALPDSFAVSDSLRAAFFATANHPMHDLPLDSARIVGQRLARFGTFGFAAGAVRLGRGWLLLETGQAGLNAERAAHWLQSADPGSRVAGAIVTNASPSNGGVVWLAEQAIPLHVAPGARPFIHTMLTNHARPLPAGAELTRGQWLRVDGDSAWIEPIDLPDTPGTMLVYVPSLRWAYSAQASAPLQMRYLLARIAEHGWAVERLGSLKDIAAPVPGSATGGNSAAR